MNDAYIKDLRDMAENEIKFAQRVIDGKALMSQSSSANHVKGLCECIISLLDYIQKHKLTDKE